MVVCESDHAGAEHGRSGDPAVDYDRAVAQASALLLAHLRACPDDVHLSLERHGDAPTLYEAVAATFPEEEQMRLTSLMWDQVARQAVAAYLGEHRAPGGDPPGGDPPAGAE